MITVVSTKQQTKHQVGQQTNRPLVKLNIIDYYFYNEQITDMTHSNIISNGHYRYYMKKQQHNCLENVLVGIYFLVLLQKFVYVFDRLLFTRA